MNLNLSKHECYPSNTIEGIYPHRIVKIRDKRTDTEWFVKMYSEADGGRPFRALRRFQFDDSDAKCILYPIENHILSEMHKLIDFENAFEGLQKMDLRKALNQKFVFADKFGEFMNSMIRAEKNGIVYGPGGYGKSEMVMDILKQAGLEQFTFIKSFGEGLSETALLGGFNMKVMREEGDMVYLLENSFVNDEIVVFEEIFDAPTTVLLTLKDILTSGMVRQGNQKVPIKCRIIIGLTNVNPDSVATDPSRHALIERFPMQFENKWDTHSANAYLSLIKKTCGNLLTIPLQEGGVGLNPELANFYLMQYSNILEEASKKSRNKISPRIALAGFSVIMSTIINTPNVSQYHHFAPLEFVTGFREIADSLKDMICENTGLIESVLEITKITDAYEKVQVDIKKAGTIKEIGKSLIELKQLLRERPRIQDRHIREYTELISRITYFVEFLNHSIVEMALGKELSQTDPAVNRLRVTSEALPYLISKFNRLSSEEAKEWQKKLRL